MNWEIFSRGETLEVFTFIIQNKNSTNKQIRENINITKDLLCYNLKKLRDNGIIIAEKAYNGDRTENQYHATERGNFMFSNIQRLIEAVETQ